jgi:hypothetical protein
MSRSHFFSAFSRELPPSLPPHWCRTRSRHPFPNATALSPTIGSGFRWAPRGTFLHLGYGSLYEKHDWRDNDWTVGGRYREMTRGLFFKASYLWRY